MKILVTMHDPDEGPGTLGDYLIAQGCELDTVRLFAGETLPADASAHGALISMGGPMSVHDTAQLPWLAEEVAFIKAWVPSGRPVLGICLGAQQIALALGAQVGKNREPEYGWGQVRLSEAGRSDTLFAGLNQEFTVLHWHGDTFTLPDGAWHLADSQACRRQAFRLGNCYALQFHFEVDREMLTIWAEGQPDATVLQEYEAMAPKMARAARKISQNWWNLLKNS